METKTFEANKVSIQINENTIQLNEKIVELVVENNNAVSGKIQFRGYCFPGLKVATLIQLDCTDTKLAKQLITQATMVAWEMEYELFISTKQSKLFTQCGFQSFVVNSNELFCAELSWNAFNKISVANVAMFLHRQN